VIHPTGFAKRPRRGAAPKNAESTTETAALT
jgi:hypothetical protein